MAYVFLLDEVLEELNLSKTKLGKLSGIRPATIIDLSKGKTKRLELPTVEKILNVLNQEARLKSINKTYRIDDVIRYEYQDGGE